MTSKPPLQAAIIPVTPLQQNCCLIWCTETMQGAFTDPGGDLPLLKAAAAKQGVTIEKLLVTHGHLDHCGQTGLLAKELGVPIEGPHEEDRFWISQLDDEAMSSFITRRPTLRWWAMCCSKDQLAGLIFHAAIISNSLIQSRKSCGRWAMTPPLCRAMGRCRPLGMSARRMPMSRIIYWAKLPNLPQRPSK